MKKFMILALASSAMVATSAQASPGITADAVGQFALSADVDTYCLFGENNSFNQGNNVVEASGDHSQGYAGADGKVVFDIQSDNNTVQNASINYRIGSVICNAPFDVTAQSLNSGLTNTTNTTTDTDFTGDVDYLVRFDLDGDEGTAVEAAPAMLLFPSDEARAGPGRVRLRVPATNQLLLEGAYTDTLTFRMTPRSSGSSE